MNWQDFINHPDVIAEQGKSPGEYLFGLITHDCLHFLNLIVASISLDKDAQILPETIRSIFYDWNILYIRTWIQKLQELQRELSKPHSVKNWEELIKEAGRIPEQLPAMVEKSSVWSFPDDKLLSSITRNLQDCFGLCKMIEQGEYLPIWNRIYGRPLHGKHPYRDYLNH